MSTRWLEWIILLVNDAKGKKPINKAGFAILFDAMWNFNKQDKYVVKKGDTIGSIAHAQHKTVRLARRLYQENVGKGIIDPIADNASDEEIANIKLKPGMVLVLLSGSNIFHYKRASEGQFPNPAQQIMDVYGSYDEEDDVEAENTGLSLSLISAIPAISGIPAVPPPRNALKALMSDINNLKSNITVSKVLKLMETHLIKQGYLIESTATFSRKLSLGANVFKLHSRDRRERKLVA